MSRRIATTLALVAVGVFSVWLLKRGDAPLQPPAEPSPIVVEPAPTVSPEELVRRELQPDPLLEPEQAERLIVETYAEGTQVEPVPPERLEAFLPRSLAGAAPSGTSSERTAIAGMPVATAQGRYLLQDQALEVVIRDLGGPKGVAAHAGWALVGPTGSASESGYESVTRRDGRVYYDAWDREASSGKRAVLLADRFEVSVSGAAASDAALGDALAAIDLEGIEGLAGR